MVNSMGAAVAPNVSSSIHTLDGADVCRVHVHASGFPVDAKVTVDKDGQMIKTAFFVRASNATRALNDTEKAQIHPRSLAHQIHFAGKQSLTHDLARGRALSCAPSPVSRAGTASGSRRPTRFHGVQMPVTGGVAAAAPRGGSWYMSSIVRRMV